MNTLKETVAEKLKDSSQVVKDFVVDNLYQDEIKKRGEMVIKAISLQENLAKELAKIKPDHIVKDETGKILTEGFTANKLADLNKAKEKSTKINTLLDKCLADCAAEDYTKLEEFIKQNAGGNKQSGSAEAKTE